MASMELFGYHLAAKYRILQRNLISAGQPLIKLWLVGLAFTAILVVNGQHVRNIDRFNIFQPALRAILFRDVGG
jgi:hypothetical protein